MTSQLLKVEEREMGLHNDLSDFSKWNYFLDFLFFVFLGLFILLSVSVSSFFCSVFLAHLHHLSPQFIHYLLLSENLSALVLSTSTSFPLFSVFCCFFFSWIYLFPASCQFCSPIQLPTHVKSNVFVYFINPTYWAISSPSLIRKLGTIKGPES